MLTTELKVRLQEIIAEYCIATDAKDVSAHMAYYAEKGFIDGGMKSRPRNAGMAEDLTQMFAMEGTLKRHLALNHRFSKEGDNIVVNYLLLVIEGELLPAVIATAQVQDIFTQENGEWKILKHTVQIDPAMFNLLKQQNTGIDSNVFNK
jgi:ketosteroid isomerase-like protein